MAKGEYKEQGDRTKVKVGWAIERWVKRAAEEMAKADGVATQVIVENAVIMEYYRRGYLKPTEVDS